MGNRTSAAANGQTSTYYQETGGSGSAGGNALNQYGSRGVPRVLDIAGLADSSATVTVNSQSTQREGEHWFKQLALSGNAAQWQSVAVSISGGGGTSGSVLLKEHPEVYTYDDDGNLTSDGRWTYAWDADGARQRGDGAPKARPKGRGGRVPFGRTAWQNRLKRMETVSSAYTAGAPRKRIDYAYDDRGRRTLKSVYTWNTSTSAFNTTPAVKVGFLYHDWNLLQEVDLSASSPATLRSYYWGLDLSGTLQGAGGVGGLLAADLDAASYSTAFYATDANGNVSDLAWALGGFAAHYEYDAFGNAFPENTGWLNLASLNSFRFSTKYTETDAASGGNETGLLYYGFRYYNPSMGRWPNRDPIRERGGINLYSFAKNNAVKWIDTDGRALTSVDTPQGAELIANLPSYPRPIPVPVPPSPPPLPIPPSPVPIPAPRPFPPIPPLPIPIPLPSDPVPNPTKNDQNAPGESQNPDWWRDPDGMVETEFFDCIESSLAALKEMHDCLDMSPNSNTAKAFRSMVEDCMRDKGYDDSNFTHLF